MLEKLALLHAGIAVGELVVKIVLAGILHNIIAVSQWEAVTIQNRLEFVFTATER